MPAVRHPGLLKHHASSSCRVGSQRQLSPAHLIEAMTGLQDCRLLRFCCAAVICASCCTINWAAHCRLSCLVWSFQPVPYRRCSRLSAEEHAMHMCT